MWVPPLALTNMTHITSMVYDIVDHYVWGVWFDAAVADDENYVVWGGQQWFDFDGAAVSDDENNNNSVYYHLAASFTQAIMIIMHTPTPATITLHSIVNHAMTMLGCYTEQWEHSLGISLLNISLWSMVLAILGSLMVTYMEYMQLKNEDQRHHDRMVYISKTVVTKTIERLAPTTPQHPNDDDGDDDGLPELQSDNDETIISAASTYRGGESDNDKGSHHQVAHRQKPPRNPTTTICGKKKKNIHREKDHDSMVMLPNSMSGRSSTSTTSETAAENPQNVSSSHTDMSNNNNTATTATTTTITITEDTSFCCSICLEDFQVGEQVCCSPNPHCRHVFHLEGCMKEWLLQNDYCPCCRTLYLVRNKKNKNNIAYVEPCTRHDEDEEYDDIDDDDDYGYYYDEDENMNDDNHNNATNTYANDDDNNNNNNRLSNDNTSLTATTALAEETTAPSFHNNTENTRRRRRRQRRRRTRRSMTMFLEEMPPWMIISGMG